MSTIERRPTNVSLEEFEAIFESVKNWGRWGDDDEIGCLNYQTADEVLRGVREVKSGKIEYRFNTEQAQTFTAQLKEQAAQIQKVRADLEMSKRGLQVVNNP